MSASPQRRPGRLQFIVVAAAFLGPLLIAAWLYFQGGSFAPTGRTNYGALLEPIINLDDALPGSAIHAHHAASWLLLYAREEPCDGRCREALHTLRQSRLILGKDMDRLTRVFLHGDTQPDTVFLAEKHRGLITLKDASLNGLLNDQRPAELPAGGYFLIDPRGNLVMYFRPDLDPSDMVDDIKRLLRLSRIG